MEWLPSVQQVIAAVFGTGIVGALGWPLVSAFFGEKAKNLATKQDIAAITREVEKVKDEFQRARDAQQHLNELALKSVDYEHQLRLAALDRQLDAHQDAYARWWNLKNKMDGAEAHDTAVECQQWWVEHNLFLSAPARKAFLDAYLAVGFMAQLKGLQDARHLQDWREHRMKVMQAGTIIAEAVALPSITVTTVPERVPGPEEGQTAS
jgi:hypothetical protein